MNSDKQDNYCFNVDNYLVNYVYENNDNFLIEESSDCLDTCVVYFSSHGIYYPDNEITFNDRIINKNYFEWYKTRHIYANKHIFVRDVKKQWYIDGINKNISTQEEVANFLRKECSLYKNVVTIGASAGGYAAILFGSLIDASLIIAFNPLIEIESKLDITVECEAALLHRRKDDPFKRKYYNLNKFINKKTSIFYVYSNKSQRDIYQKNQTTLCDNLFFIEIDSCLHGVPIPKDICLYFISKNKEELKKYTNRINTMRKIYLSISVNKFVKYLMRKFYGKMRYYINILSKKC